MGCALNPLRDRGLASSSSPPCRLHLHRSCCRKLCVTLAACHPQLGGVSAASPSLSLSSDPSQPYQSIHSFELAVQ
ncbi:hypothetical protein I3760_14G085800 [Carya illinoinensis]|nr:hypothetical protein I3760_14G085800 [Carya illinoinensis]